MADTTRISPFSQQWLVWKLGMNQGEFWGKVGVSPSQGAPAMKVGGTFRSRCKYCCTSPMGRRRNRKNSSGG